MRWEQIKLEKKAYEEGAEQVLEGLREAKADRQECSVTMMLLEELSICLWEKCGTEAPIQIRVVRRFGEVSLLLSVKGEEYDPVREENIFSQEEEDYYRRLIIRAHREKLGCSYRGGKNLVRITVHTTSSKNVYYSLGAMAAGILVGLLMKAFLPENICNGLNINLFAVIKTLFLNSLKMMVAPVIFFSIAGSISSLTDLSDVGKMGGKLLGIYMATTFIAIAIGLLVGSLLSIGSISFQTADSTSALIGQTFEVSVKDIIAGIAPSNLVSPISEGNMLQIIFVSVIFGIAANILGDQIKLIGDFLSQMNALCLKIVILLVRFIPIAAFCSMASMIVTTGAQALLVVLRILAGVLLGAVLMITVYMLLILVFGRLSPLPFLKKALNFAPTPFSLASSNAAMPFTMNFCEEKLGVPKRVSSFSIPLGATLNMDGTCVYLAVCILLLMKLYGMPLTGGALTTIVLSIFVLSIGAPGVTGSGVICLSTLVVSLGLPVECIGIVIGIDQIAGMLRTASNTIGDTAAAVIVAGSQGILDKEKYKH